MFTNKLWNVQVGFMNGKVCKNQTFLCGVLLICGPGKTYVNERELMQGTVWICIILFTLFKRCDDVTKC